jgi:hypothetical protein
MTKFGDMSSDEQKVLVADIGKMLNKHGIPAEVKIVQEIVYNMQ